MATTSIKLPDDIKKRVKQSSEKQGLSAHAFMVKAIERAVEAEERKASFIADAKAARAEALRSGKGYSAAETHTYIRSRIRQDKTEQPKAITWRK
ncbi:MAG TPA: hypothetical protein ENK26_00010 [Gammaproteobacteria bacterium]|nr:hypothetical protein [Gammaproteobacteria bacterium]